MSDKQLALNIPSPENFTTSDTDLSAWLCISGFELLNVNKTNSHSTFVFKQSDELRKAILSWNSGNAVGNCCNFSNQRRNLLRIVKNNEL